MQSVDKALKVVLLRIGADITLSLNVTHFKSCLLLVIWKGKPSLK